jgi:hypothetical protein
MISIFFFDYGFFNLLNFFHFLTVFWVVFDDFSLGLCGMFPEGSFVKKFK